MMLALAITHGPRDPVKLILHYGEFVIPQPEELKQDNRKVVGIGTVVIGIKARSCMARTALTVYALDP